MRISTAITLVSTWLILGAAAAAQPAFDMSAYRQFLEATKDLSASGLKERFPAGTFTKTIGGIPTISYLDAIDLKYKLTDDEKSLLKLHGFMVSERLSDESFTSALTSIYHADLPVFISTDLVLHTIHVSYDQILKELEYSVLVPSLDSLLTKMHGDLPALAAGYKGRAEMAPMLRDVDLYLTVARRLLRDDAVAPVFPENAQGVGQILSLVAGGGMREVELFSVQARQIDFSQFTPRGHYTESEQLKRYFQSMIWLGRTDVELDDTLDAGRQAVDAALIAKLCGSADARALYERCDSVIIRMVGESDNVTLQQLTGLLQETGITAPEVLLDAARRATFQKTLATRPFAGQRINSRIIMSDGTEPGGVRLPSVFLLFGQRFTVDSYVMGKVVFDRISARRMLPSSLDVLFALGNNGAGQLLEPELGTYGYAPQLASLRYLVDSYGDDFWKSSIYNGWLGAIRTLNIPSDRSRLPRFMQTAAWWQEKMNTQLASWAELRHDNLLYVKQSYTGFPTCSFPRSLVEPIPAFYRAVADFAADARKQFDALPFNNAGDKEQVGTYLSRLASIAARLGDIADKELASEPLSDDEREFLCSMLSVSSVGCGTNYDGWFFDLFYGKSANRDDDAKKVVADVHTSPADAEGNAVGWVMHVGTGPINLAVVMCEMPDGESVAFVGPVMSYYEHVTTNFQRLTDEQWETMYDQSPSVRPSWTNLYLAGKNGEIKGTAPSLTADVIEEPGRVSDAEGVRLLPSSPNPFDAGTVIPFSIPVSAGVSNVELSVFDESGKGVVTLLKHTLSPGSYSTRWDGTASDGRPVPEGRYLYRLTVGSVVLSGKVVLQRSSR